MPVKRNLAQRRGRQTTSRRGGMSQCGADSLSWRRRRRECTRGTWPSGSFEPPCRAEGSTWGTGCDTLLPGHPQAGPRAEGRAASLACPAAVTVPSVCCDPCPPVPTSWSPFLTQDLVGRFTSRSGIPAHNPLLSFGKVTWCPGRLPAQP